MLYLYNNYRTNNIIIEDKIILFVNYFQFKVDGKQIVSNDLTRE